MVNILLHHLDDRERSRTASARVVVSRDFVCTVDRLKANSDPLQSVRLSRMVGAPR